MKTKATVNCLGYPVYAGELDNYDFSKKTYINTINQYSYCIAEKDENFKKSLLSSDILLPDGVGITAASKFLNHMPIAKFSGSDLHGYLLKKMNKEGGRVFYLGSSNDVLAKIEERLSKEYPNIKVGSYSPPYKDEFSSADNDSMINAVNAFEPDVLFVGMTAPKQEKWTNQNRKYLNANIVCAVGAVFDFYAGTVERPNEVWVNSGFEWLGRLVKEPKRMWKRYMYYGAVFAYYLLKEILFSSYYYKKNNLLPF